MNRKFLVTLVAVLGLALSTNNCSANYYYDDFDDYGPYVSFGGGRPWGYGPGYYGGFGPGAGVGFNVGPFGFGFGI